MKKIVFATATAVLIVVAVIVAMRFFGAEPVSAQNEPSERSAKILQEKIDAIQEAEGKENAGPARTVEISDVELESYVLYRMRDEIPAKVDSIDVQLTEDVVGADTRLTFPSNATNNPLVDAFVSGTHTFFMKGKLVAADGRGRFELQEVKVDGIPVPLVLIETLVEKYVKPDYPEVDLKEPFPMPWGMESLKITPDKATIVY